MALHVALRFGYDGQCFPCYARDPARPGSIEAHIVAALEGEGLVPGSFRTGSRTDAGVSAVGNVCGASVERAHLEGFLESLRSRLPEGVWPTAVAEVDAGWNPRHASSRHYVHWAVRAGDVDAARATAACFLGRHDMRAFARLEEGRDPVREVQAVTVTDHGDLRRVDVVGPSFLWNQVRRMVGAMQAVATGLATQDDVRSALDSGTPHPTFIPADAAGLVLWDVDYPELEWRDAKPSRGLDASWVAAESRAQVVGAVRARLNGSA